MDVVSFPPTGKKYRLGAYFRNPLAKRCDLSAFSRSGFAACCGEPLSRDRKVELCVIESFGRLGDKFLSVLDQAVLLTRSYHADLSAVVRNLRKEWPSDISAACKKAIARNYRTLISGNYVGEAPFHTLFPVPKLAANPQLRLHMQGSPLTSTLHNVGRSHAYSIFANRPSTDLQPVSGPPAAPCIEGARLSWSRSCSSI